MIKELNKLLGNEATMRLLSRYGGLQIYIPKKLKQNHAITLAIGQEAADKLAERFGGDNVELPMWNRPFQERRKERINEMHKQGIPVQQIAQRVGCSRRYVYFTIADNHS